MKHGEQSRDAVLREVREETGLQQIRPQPLAQLRYRSSGGHVLDWVTDLYLVEMPDKREPVPEDLSEGISGWKAVGHKELARWITLLESIQDERHAWGLFRADAMRYLLRRLDEGRL